MVFKNVGLKESKSVGTKMKKYEFNFMKTFTIA